MISFEQEEWNLPGSVAENEAARRSATPAASDLIVTEVENHQEEPEVKEPEVVVNNTEILKKAF